MKPGLKDKILKSIVALVAIWAVDYSNLAQQFTEFILSFF